MLFPKLILESTLQVGDKTRLNARQSYVSKDEAALTVVEIEPEAGAGFIDVFDASSKNWFLDYEYATDGAKVVTVRVDNGSTPVTSSFTINVLTEADDHLFSTDEDLVRLESDIMKYLPDGKSSYKNIHREAQLQILQYLYKIGIVDISGNKLTKNAIVDIEEVRFWSKYVTHRIIFEDLSTSSGDFFQAKSERFGKEENEWRHASKVALDLNGDGTVDSTEGVDITWRRLNRV